MIVSPRRGCCLLLFAFGVFVSGCGSPSAAVQGTVTLDDTPVESGYITFVPSEGTAGAGGRASIVQGRYVLDSASQMQPGVYRVEIFAPRKTGKKIPMGSPAPRGTMVDEEVEAVPARYNKNSTLRQELKAGSNPVNFTLSSP